MEGSMNNSSQPQFSEETGYFYNQFAVNGGLLISNGKITQPIAALPNTLTREEFQHKAKAELSSKKCFRYSLPSCYVDGGKDVLPHDWNLASGYGFYVKNDPHIAFANFVKEECEGKLLYLSQIKKWFWKDQWIVTFDFCSEKTERVHLVYDVKEAPEEAYIDEYVDYDDFFTKYDALDPQCFEPVPCEEKGGIPVSEVVESITENNCGRPGRIDVDYENFTCHNEDNYRFHKKEFYHSNEEKDVSIDHELRDFMPHTRCSSKGTL